MNEFQQDVFYNMFKTQGNKFYLISIYRNRAVNAALTRTKFFWMVYLASSFGDYEKQIIFRYFFVTIYNYNRIITLTPKRDINGLLYTVNQRTNIDSIITLVYNNKFSKAIIYLKSLQNCYKQVSLNILHSM